jgi:hypothetical protein
MGRDRLGMGKREGCEERGAMGEEKETDII